jgi:hypothetical protein
LKRELEGARVRGDEEYEKNVLDELKRLGEGEATKAAAKTRAKRSRATAKARSVAESERSKPATYVPTSTTSHSGVTTSTFGPAKTGSAGQEKP